MTPERWQQIKRLFHAALDHEPAQRPGFLVRECADDGPLSHEVESLLASHEQAECFIETPASEVAAALLAENQPGLVAGQMVGPYKIAGALATRGMGEVYLADDARLGRKIALKLLPPQFTVNADRVRLSGRRRGRPLRSTTQTSSPSMRSGRQIPSTSSPPSSLTARPSESTWRTHG